jgi:hypothetical protein
LRLERGLKQLCFRPHAIEAWEVAQDRSSVISHDDPPQATISKSASEVAARKLGWDGVYRLKPKKPLPE